MAGYCSIKLANNTYVMIRVGITFNPNKPLWYSGLNQTAWLLAELFQVLHTEVILVDYTNGEQEWCTDYPRPSIPLAKLYQLKDIDLLLDIDGHTSEASRSCATKTVIFLRTFLQFAEMDSQLYIETPYVPRCMKGVDEIWCWDILNPPETIPSIQTLFPCPIRRVPFIWSPTVSAHFQKQIQSDDVTVHITEKNTDNSSSSIIPLVAIREISKWKSEKIAFKVHNMEHCKDNRFLKENILNNIEFDTLPVVFAEKAPWYEWSDHDILLSHSRFTPLRISLLHAVWMGIHLIHNSPFLRDLCPSLHRTYYESNSIQGIQDRIIECVTDMVCLHDNNIVEECRAALSVYSIQTRQTEWKQMVDCLFLIPSKPSKPMNLDTCPLVVAFDDMWPGFNVHSNFIMDALRHERPDREIKGMMYDSRTPPHLLIFGPYSQNWKNIDCPKIYFSGENWPHPDDPSISLYLSSSPIEDARHMRVPTWMHFIDWYSNETTLPTNQEDNPIRIPLHFAMTPHPVSFEQREKFCAFVVSNPICPCRNDAFYYMNQYKPVSSGGAYQNNIGGQLHLKYAGGGCGDISKHHFFAEHKFTISFENSQSPGYLTEKLLHAKMAGCVPLYWGDVSTDFNPNSFINLSHMTNAASIVDVIKKLEANPAICQTIASTPPLDEQRKQAAYHTISAMCQRIFQVATTPTSVTSQDVLDTIYLINLDTRPDRLHTFQAAHPDLSVTRISAVDGKKLQMTDQLYTLCAHNKFQWKKSVIACALSHISVWNKIVAGTATYTLILEDDVRMNPDWKKQMRNIPEDAELLYLGGVLPVNRQALPHAVEKVNEYWSQLKPNTFFTKEPLPIFHFCAYSYVLTKKGAQKLLDYLAYSHDKLCIPVDHLIGNYMIGLKKYIASTTLTTCFQEEDPQYNDAQFNDIQTEKKFDSDIYNNTECFDVSLYTEKALQSDPVTIYYLSEKAPELYEQTWLEDMFQKPIVFQSYSASLPPNAWCLLQRPHVDQWTAILAALKTPFRIIHLSDEFGTDRIDCYTFPMCTNVIRNYIRDCPGNVHVIPLGYHHKPVNAPPVTERKLVWSFHGTDWFNREAQLKQFVPYTPHHCKLQPQWDDPSKTKKREYLADLTNSIWCPVLRGNNPETFRFYEALEAGTLPIAIEANAYTAWIDSHLHLSDLYAWTTPAILEKPCTTELQREVISRWNRWKEEVRQLCR